MGLQCVELGVEEGHVEPHKPAKEACDLEAVGGDFEGLEIEQGAGLGREDAHAHYRARDDHRGEDDEAQHARRPREANLRQQLVEDDGVDDAAEGAAGGRDADGHADARAEVRAQDGDGGDEQRARADADAERLREKDLPVRRAQGEHHLPEDEHEGAEQQELAEVARVVDGACQRADFEEEEGLDAADPGDAGGRGGGEKCGFVVCLVGAKSI